MSDEAGVVTVPVDALKQHPDNPRKGDVAAIMRSLERFGQVKPIIVQRSTGYVVAGNHTLEAARRLEWPTIRIQLLDVDDATARAYLIADNRTADRATYNKDSLYELLGQELGNLEGTGFSADEVEDAIMGAQEHDPRPEVPKREIKGTGDAKVDEAAKNYDPYRTISIAVRLSEMEEFAKRIAALQEHWEARTTTEVVRRIVNIAYEALPKPEEGFKAEPAAVDY